MEVLLYYFRWSEFIFSPGSTGSPLHFNSSDWVTGFRSNLMYEDGEEEIDEADFELQPPPLPLGDFAGMEMYQHDDTD